MYILTFIISTILIALSENELKKRRRNFGKTLAFFALFFPSLLAGMRADNIGIDISYYVLPAFENALRAKSINQYFNILTIDIDRGFALLVYFCSRISKEVGLVLFLLQFLTILPVYLTLKKYSNKLSVVLGFIIYFLVFFNTTLCVMRQFLSISILLYATTFLLNDKYFKFILLISISLAFHISTLLPIVIILNFKLFNNLIAKAIWIRVLLVVIFFVAYYEIYNIINLLARIGIFDDKYFDRLDRSGAERGLLTMFFFLILTFYPFLIAWKRKKHLHALFSIYPLLGFIAFYSGNISEYIGRLSFSFLIFSIIALPLGMNSVPKNRRRWHFFILVTIMLIYWYRTFIINNAWETYPYEFRT